MTLNGKGRILVGVGLRQNGRGEMETENMGNPSVENCAANWGSN